MSLENVELVRASFDVWNTGDMDAYGELLDPDVTSHTPEGWPEPGSFVGREAVLAQFQRNRDAWDNGDLAEPIGDLLDAGGRVAARWVWRGRGHGPGLTMESSCVWSLRNGKICGFEFFWDHGEALEAAGLSP